MAEVDTVTDPQDAIRHMAGRLLDTRLDELVHRAVDRRRAGVRDLGGQPG